MLFSALVILIFLILGFLLATAKLSVSIEDTSYLKVFYVLMFITFLTVLEIIFCVYMYVKFRTKDGEEGPQGYHGFPGDKGDPGKCNQQNCRPDVIRVMIEKIFQKKLGRELTTEEKQLIFKYKANINTIINKSKFSTITKDGSTIYDLTFDQVKDIHDVITKDVELDYFQLDVNNPNSFETSLKNYFTGIEKDKIMD